MSKEVWVGKPSFSFDYTSDTELEPRGVGFASVNYPNEVKQGLNAGTVDWSFTGPLSYITGNLYTARYTASNSTGSGWIKLEVSNTCPETGWNELYYQVIDNWLLMMSPNPTTGETTLSIESTSATAGFDETSEWELEIYSPMQTLMEKRAHIKGNNIKIQTYGWTEGIYVVLIKLKDDILEGKLVVKR